MKNTNDMKYWDPEHYVLKVVTGSLAVCMRVFKTDQASCPTREYGTHVYNKVALDSTRFEITIRRFKTKELCTKHLEYPPTHIREGKVL